MRVPVCRYRLAMDVINSVTDDAKRLDQAVASLVGEIESLRKALDAERKYRRSVDMVLVYSIEFINEGLLPQMKRDHSVRMRMKEIIETLRKLSFCDSFERARKDSGAAYSSHQTLVLEAKNLGHPEAHFDALSFSFQGGSYALELKKIADMGCAAAQLKFGVSCGEEEYLRMAVAEGLYGAGRELGRMLWRRGNVEEGLSLLRRAVTDGDELASEEYAKCLYYSYCVPRNRVEAARYFKRAADMGDNTSDIKTRYAERVCCGNCVPRDIREASRYFKLAADEGDSRLKMSYAERLSKGDGVPRDVREASRYFKLAADEGDSWL